MKENQTKHSNLPLVVTIAKQYKNQGLELQELINVGTLGLENAAKNFDETNGSEFNIFAVWLIRKAIHQAIATPS